MHGAVFLTETLFLTIMFCEKIAFGTIFSFLLVQYALHLYDYFKEWRKNPEWSFSCCLALLLPLNDKQGDIFDVTGTNVLQTLLDTGEFEMVTLQSAVQDSGVIDVTLEEGKEGDDDTVEEQENSRQVPKYSSQKCEQETQIKLISIFSAPSVMLR